MKTTTYLKYGGQLINLGSSTAWQRYNCDRVVLDKDKTFIKNISHEELKELDREIKSIPVEPMMVGEVVPIMRELKKREIDALIELI